MVMMSFHSREILSFFIKRRVDWNCPRFHGVFPLRTTRSTVLCAQCVFHCATPEIGQRMRWRVGSVVVVELAESFSQLSRAVRWQLFAGAVHFRNLAGYPIGIQDCQ